MTNPDFAPPFPDFTRYDASLRDIYVIHDGTGDDSGPGTMAEPLATIREAVNRFKPSHLANQYWATGDDRVIHVLNGGVTITEAVPPIPDHSGGGVLHIAAEENVLHAGLEISSAPVGVAGFEGIERIGFTTSPMTPSAHALSAFWRPNAAARTAAGYTNLLESTFEDLTIQDNAGGTVDVTGDRFFSYFGGSIGDVGDIVTPQITWAPTQGGAFFLGEDALTSSSYLLVSGFIFSYTAGVNTSTRVLNSQATTKNLFGTRPVTAARCRFTSDTGVLPIAAGSVGFHGCLFEPSANQSTIFRDLDVIIANCAVTHGGVTVEGSLFEAYALYVDATSVSTAMSFHRGSDCIILLADLRGSSAVAVALNSGSKVGTFTPITGLTIGTTFSQAFFLNRKSQLNLDGSSTRLAGSGTFAAAQVFGSSQLTLSVAASMPVVGPGGTDVIVGQLAAISWTGVAAGVGQNDTAGDMSSYYRSS